MSQGKWVQSFFDVSTYVVRFINTYIFCCTPRRLKGTSITAACIEMVGGFIGFGIQVFTLLIAEKVVTWQEVFGSLSEAGAFFMMIVSSATVLEYLAHIGLSVTLLCGILTDEMVLIEIWLWGATGALIAGIAMLGTHIYGVFEYKSSSEENVLPMTWLVVCIVVMGIYLIGTVDMYKEKRLEELAENERKSAWL